MGYKEKVIKKLEKELEGCKENSGSWIFFNRVLNIGLDIFMWGLLIFALYLYIQSGRGASIGCDKISVDLCNQCFIPAKQAITGGLLG